METMILFARCGLTMSLLVIALCPLTAHFGKRYSSQSIYAAWVLVLAGFLIPIRPHFTYSVPMEPARIPSTEIAPYVATGQPILNQPLPVEPAAPNWAEVIFIIWLAGFAVVLGYHHVRNYHFYRMVKRWWEVPDDDRLLDIFSREKALLSSASDVKLMLCSTISSPMLIGIIKPVILLPEASTASDEIHLIIRHELIHHRRKDLLIKLLQVLVISLHWYNPVAYLLVRMVNMYCEISCDAAVLKGESMAECTAYCKAILEYAHSSSYTPALTSSYSAGKKFLEKRFDMIMNPKAKRMGIVITAIVFFAALITGATWAAEPKYDQSIYVSEEAAAEAEIAVSTVANDSVEDQNQRGQQAYATRQEFLESFSHQNIDLKEGQTPQHFIHNGELAVYTNSGEKWALTAGDVVTISTKIDPILVEGHSIGVGYILDNTYVELHNGKVKKDLSLEFEAPETGEYNFYLAGFSSDKIRVQSFVVDTHEVDNGFFFVLPVSNVTAYPYVSEESGTRLVIPCEDKTSVRASEDGIVTKVVSGYTGYGKYVMLDHGNGYTTLYAHNSELKVAVGDQVAKGQVIARAGRTGWATDYGLGFEIRKNGDQMNPLDYVDLTDSIFDPDGYIFGISDEDRVTVDKVLESSRVKSKIAAGEGFCFLGPGHKMLYSTPKE